MRIAVELLNILVNKNNWYAIILIIESTKAVLLHRDEYYLINNTDSNTTLSVILNCGDSVALKKKEKKR